MDEKPQERSAVSAASPSPAIEPSPVSGETPVSFSGWHGDGLRARSVRFALTLMTPVVIGMIGGTGYWLIYATLTCILAYTLDLGDRPVARLRWMSVAGVVVIVGTGIGTLAAGHLPFIVLAFACAGALYALVESLHVAIATAARFLCLTIAVGALYAPINPVDVGVVVIFVVYAWGVSLLWDWVSRLPRPSTAPSLPELFARIRASERERRVFAAAVALTIPLAFLFSSELGLHRPYWAMLAIVLVLRADSISSRTLMVQMLMGTLLGVFLAVAYGYLFPYHPALLAGMLLAALLRWPAQQWHGALGNAALTVFIMLFLELVSGGLAQASHDLVERVVDVMVGCAFAMVALLLDRTGQALLRWLRPHRGDAAS